MLWFRSPLAGADAVFSFFSFGLVFGILYTWLLALSLLAGPLPVHGLVTIPLGRVDGWPRWARAVLPFFATAILWWLASWLLIRLDSPARRCRPPGDSSKSLILGASSYLLWKFPLGGILVLHLLNSYVYFGQTSVLEIRERDGANHFASAGKNSVASQQGGFCAAGGDGADFSRRPFCGTRPEPALQPAAVLKSAFQSLPAGRAAI